MPTGPSTTAPNGTRLYGETDATGPLFSDFLNLALSSIDKLFNRFRAYKSSVFALTSALAGVPAFDVTYRNTLPGTWNATAGTFTATSAVVVRAHGEVTFAANATGTTARTVAIQKAPAATPTAFVTTNAGLGFTATSSGSNSITLPVTDIVPLAIGDVLRLASSSGTNLNLVGALFEIEVA